MSAKFETIGLEAPGYATSLDCMLGNISLRLLNANEDRPGTLGVELGDGQMKLHEFAERGARAPDGAFPAVVYALSFDLNVYLVGLFSIYSIDRRGKVEKLLDLFRSPRDDAGFYESPELLCSGESLFLKYESGIACFSSNGDFKWHRQLMYDDILERFDDSKIWFSNEHVDKGTVWTVSVENGERD